MCLQDLQLMLLLLHLALQVLNLLLQGGMLRLQPVARQFRY
jgi:hypothetical protein